MSAAEIIVYTSPYCFPCLATKRILDDAGAPYRLVDVAEDEVAARFLENIGCRQTPVVEVRLPDGIDRWTGHIPEKVKAAAWLVTVGEES